MSTIRRFDCAGFVLAILALGLQSACTHLYQQPLHSVQLAEVASKIDIPVELIITEAFRNAKWERNYMGDKFILPVGENLAHHAERVTKGVFARVLLRERVEGGAAPPSAAANLYRLEPKLVFINQSFGVTAFSEARTSIGIEWKLLNSRGESVWVETIHGEGLGTPGNMFTHRERQKERFQLALVDLFHKSQAAMSGSQVLRGLPQSK
jgi:hypothetical protein